MKFHFAILQPNGLVTGKGCHDTAEIHADAASQRIRAQFKRLLREKLGHDPVCTGRFLSQFGDSRHLLAWQQIEPLSALGMFSIGGQLVAACIYLHGFVPELDQAVIAATEPLFGEWFNDSEMSESPCSGLKSISERPLLIVRPAGNDVLTPSDWRIIGNLSLYFAAIFFERAEAAIKQIDTFWQKWNSQRQAAHFNPRWN